MPRRTAWSVYVTCNVISVHIAPHLTKSRPISHLVNTTIERSHKTHFYDVRESPKSFSHALLLTDVTSIAAVKHMHNILLMQVCIEQKQSGDGKASVKPPRAS
jgi:hypothetical protein